MPYYCTPDDVRHITDLSDDDLSDNSLWNLIKDLTAQINRDISVEVIEETIDYIDASRENKIDGSNTVFYTKSSYDFYLGDRNNDGELTVADVVVYQYDSNNDKTELTVSAIDEIGKVTLSSAPASSCDLKISYTYTPYSVATPHGLVKNAMMYLVAAYAYGKVDPANVKSITLGDLKVVQDAGGATRGLIMQYESIIDQITYRTALIGRKPFKYRFSLDFEDL